MARSVCALVLLGTLLAAVILVPSAEAQGSEFAGLWIGDVAVQEVSRIGETSLEKTADVLHQRILLHVDANQRASLLRSVAVVWSEEGGQPGLYADEESLEILVQGAAGRDLTIKRLATASFDFPVEDASEKPPRYASTLPLDGKMGRGESLSTPKGGLVIGASHRSNPFRHVYHHEHRKGFDITREITLTIDRDSPTSSLPASELLSAKYRETLRGLTKKGAPIQMGGTVTLRRVSDTSRLNEMPTAIGGSR